MTDKHQGGGDPDPSPLKHSDAERVTGEQKEGGDGDPQSSPEREGETEAPSPQDRSWKSSRRR